MAGRSSLDAQDAGGKQKVSASGPHTAAAPGERLHSVAAPLIAFCRGTPLIAVYSFVVITLSWVGTYTITR